MVENPQFSSAPEEFFSIVEELERKLKKEINVKVIGKETKDWLLKYSTNITSINNENQDTKRRSLRNFHFESFDLLNFLDEDYDVIISINLLEYIYFTYNHYEIDRILEAIRRKSLIFITTIPEFESNAFWNNFLPENPLYYISKFTYFYEFATTSFEKWLCHRTLIFASNKYIYINGELSSIELLKNFEKPIESYKKRVYKLNANVAVLQFQNAQSNEYFESNELKQIKDLENIEMQFSIFPRIKFKKRGKYSCIFLRNFIEGVPASMLTKENISNTLLMSYRKFMIEYSQNSIYLNDIRPWNVVFNGNIGSFFDFELTSNFENDADGLPEIVTYICTYAILRSGNDIVWNTRAIVEILTDMVASGQLDGKNNFFHKWVNLNEYDKHIDYSLCNNFHDAIHELSRVIDFVQIRLDT